MRRATTAPDQARGHPITDSPIEQWSDSCAFAEAGELAVWGPNVPNNIGAPGLQLAKILSAEGEWPSHGRCGID
jgi:hypothetical protein